MKYIMLETKDGAKLPIIFPDVLTHCFVAGAMQLAVDTLDPKKDLRPRQLDDMLARGDAKPVSAGFINLGAVMVHGKSESLDNLPHNKSDAQRIMMGEAAQFMPDEMILMMAQKLGL